MNLEAHASAPANGRSRTGARAGVATSAMDAATATDLEAAAFTIGLPTDEEAGEFFAGNSDLKKHFNIASDGAPGATSDIFGLVTLGGSHSEEGSAASRTCTSSVTYAIDLTALVNPRQDLLVGLLDTVVEGSGFDSLDFEITRENTKVVDETFMAVAEAVEFFESNLLNLGANSTTTVSGNLDLVFTMSLTTDDADAGFYFDLLFGNSTLNSGLPPGDYNGNGLVEQADLDLVLGNWGATTPPIPERWVHNPPTDVIDQAELDNVLSNWGRSATGLAFTTAVPEPSTLLLSGLLSAAAVWIVRIAKRAD